MSTKHKTKTAPIRRRGRKSGPTKVAKKRRRQRKRKATISDANSRHFALESAHEDTLGPQLTCSARKWAATEARGVQITKDLRQFYEIDKKGRMLIPYGFLNQVVRKLEDNHVNVDLQISARGQYVEKIAPQSDIEARIAKPVSRLENLPRAGVLASSGSDTINTIGAIATMFPDAQIAVCTHSWKEAHILRKKLAKNTDRKVVVNKEDFVPKAPNVENRRFIQVMTGQASQAASMPEFFDIRIDVGRKVALSKWVRETPWGLQSMRVFAILPHGRVSLHEWLQLQEAYTDKWFEVKARNAPPPVCVALVQGSDLRFRRNTSRFDFSRTQVWENKDRNFRIAELARGITARNFKALGELGIDLSDDLRDIINDEPQRGVTILVANPTHGRALKTLLPEFEFEHVSTSEISESIFDARANRIMTHAAAEARDIASQIVIRADGGRGWPLQPKSFPLSGLDLDAAVVFDIDDLGCERVRELVQSRLEAYQQLGWSLPTEE